MRQPFPNMVSLITVACLLPLSLAEQVTFQNTAMPHATTLDGWYLFRVYSKMGYIGATGSSLESAEKPKAQISLAGVQKEKNSGYKSLEVSLIYYEHFLNQKLHEENFCVDGKLKPSSNDVLEFKSCVIPFDDDEAVCEATLNKTGKYLLMISNCANFTSGQISGVAQVKNPYGYLPPEQYHSIIPLFFFLAVYVLCLAGYGAYGLQKSKQFYDTHFYFLGLFFLCLAEVGGKLLAFYSWNSSGADEPWMTVATVLYVLKWIFLYMMATYVALGMQDKDTAGRGEEDVQFGTKHWCIAFVTSTLYTVALSLRECVLLYRPGGDLGPSFVAGACAPVLVMDAVLVIFLLIQTQKQYEESEAKLNIHKSALYAKLNKIAVAIAVFGVVAMMVDLADVLAFSNFSWRMQWLPQEGTAHILGLFAVTTASFVMRPGMLERKNEYTGAKGGDFETGAEMVGRAVDSDDDM
mmetsp:Transcript_31291/g.71440  ORF Transcript_31291/g.71440 Transcript_31291/m.71440 type:complete len:465 (-) Transcript_31291:74-1468(-)